MSITKTLLAGAAGTALASGMAVADEPKKLSTTEMDQVTAGFFIVAANAFPNILNGLTASFNESLSANGVETVAVDSPTNFTSTITANASGTATGQGTAGLVEIPGVGPTLVPGNFVFGRVDAAAQVATNVVFP